MAIVAKTAETEIVRRSETGAGYADWGAIFAGAVVATAISMMFVAFGSALGLSLTSFADRQAMPGLGVIIAIGLWLVWLQVTASLGGGYVAGRLRRRIGDAQRHEVEMRDGLHGLVVWALGVLIGSLVAAWLTSLATMGAATVGAGAASNPQAASTAMSDYYVDRLLRTGGPAATEAAPSGEAAPAAGTAPAASRPADPETRAELGRLLGSNLVTSAESEDRAYLVRRISAATGLGEQQAAERLDSTLAVMKARADQARRLAVLMAFITAASLLVSAVAAWWAATKGGSHRDDAVDHSRYTTWR